MVSNSLANNSKKGFALGVVSIIMLILGLILITKVDTDPEVIKPQFEQTKQKQQKIKEALELYKKANGDKYPCPASISRKIDNSDFGLAWKCNPEPADTCGDGGDSPPCLDTDSEVVGLMDPAHVKYFPGNGVIIGAVPTKDLNLPDDYAFDEWGRRFVYGIDRSQALNGSGTPSDIKIEDSNGVVIKYYSGGIKTTYALFSAGPNGIGAYSKEGSLYKPCAQGSVINTEELLNCDYTSVATIPLDAATFRFQNWQLIGRDYSYDDAPLDWVGGCLNFDCECAHICFDASKTETIFDKDGNSISGAADVDEITKWKSVRGNYTAYQSTIAYKPKYEFEAYANEDNNAIKYNAISFDGLNDFMPIFKTGTELSGQPEYLCLDKLGSANCSENTNNMTVLIVFRPKESGLACLKCDNAILMGNFEATDSNIWSLGVYQDKYNSEKRMSSSIVDAPEQWSANTLEYNEQLQPDDKFLYSYKIGNNGTQAQFRVNGVGSTLSDLSNHLAQNFKSKLSMSHLLYSDSGSNYGTFSGELMEIRIFKKALSDLELQTAECELSGKWGVFVPHCQNLSSAINSCPSGVGACTVWLDSSDKATVYGKDSEGDCNNNGTPGELGECSATDCNNNGTAGEPDECDNIDVKIWQDKSGNENNFYSIATDAAPTFYPNTNLKDAIFPNKSGVYFDSGDDDALSDYKDDFMRTDYDLKSDQYTVLVAFSASDYTNKSAVLGGALIRDSTQHFALFNHNGVIDPYLSSINANWKFAPEQAGANGTTYVASMVADHTSNNGGFYLNGHLRKRFNGNIITGDAYVPRMLSLAGFPLKTPSSQFKGVVHEVLVYERILSDVESKAVTCGMANKWGVEAIDCDLDSHPYKSANNCPPGTSNCILWLDANDIGTIDTDLNGKVKIWRDKSGKRNTGLFADTYTNDAFTADKNKRPTFQTNIFNGLPAIYFAEKEGLRSNAEICTDFMESDGSKCHAGGKKSYSIFAVYRPVSTADLANYDRMLIKANHKLATSSIYLAPQTEWNSLSTTDPNVVMISHDGDIDMKLHINGESKIIDDTDLLLGSQGIYDFIYQTTNQTNQFYKSSTVPNYFVFGYEGSLKDYTASNEKASGHLAEVIVYDVNLNSIDSKTIECDLANKWGVTMQLGYCP